MMLLERVKPLAISKQHPVSHMFRAVDFHSEHSRQQNFSAYR